MPKLKTKSSVKKRFKTTATGKIKSGQANKRHNRVEHRNGSSAIQKVKYNAKYC